MQLSRPKHTARHFWGADAALNAAIKLKGYSKAYNSAGHRMKCTRRSLLRRQNANFHVTCIVAQPSDRARSAKLAAPDTRNVNTTQLAIVDTLL